MTLADYHQEAFEKALQRNLRALSRGKIPADKPVAILLGGQSGAGKTTIHRIKQAEYQGNLIVIDGDSFRPQHPRFQELQTAYGKDSVAHTQQFAGQMVESLIEALSQQGYHLLIEGTLRTSAVPRQTAKLLRSRGYQTELAIIAAKPRLSYLSTLIRYEELAASHPADARATPKDYHDAIVSHLVENMATLEASKLFSRIQIYQRDRSCAYDSSQDKQPAAEVLEILLFGPWSKAEEEMLASGLKRLEELKTARAADGVE